MDIIPYLYNYFQDDLTMVLIIINHQPKPCQNPASPGAGNPPSSRRPCWLRLAGPAMAALRGSEIGRVKRWNHENMGGLPWENVVFTMEHVVLIMKNAEVSMVSTGIIPIWSRRNEVANTV